LLQENQIEKVVFILAWNTRVRIPASRFEDIFFFPKKILVWKWRWEGCLYSCPEHKSKNTYFSFCWQTMHQGQQIWYRQNKSEKVVFILAGTQEWTHLLLIFMGGTGWECESWKAGGHSRVRVLCFKLSKADHLLQVKRKE